MATISFKAGLLANLPATLTAGTFYITKDERAMYLDVDSETRVRLGDFQEFATVEALEANENPSTTALYYITEINCLAKWNGTAYVQINLDTGANDVVVSGTGNVVTGITYNPNTRVLTVTKGNMVNSVGATANMGVVVDNTDTTAPTIGIRLSSKIGNALSFATDTGEDGGLYYQAPTFPTITLRAKSTANTGYVRTYQLLVDGVVTGDEVDIPKDFFVKDAGLKTATAEDVAAVIYEDVAVGDKYIDLVINTVGDDETDIHIYIPVKALVDVYTADGMAIHLTASNQFYLLIDATNANGLEQTANGLKLNMATPDTYTSGVKTSDGTAGAMSSADKYKLDNISAGASKVASSSTNGNILVDGSEVSVYTLPNDVAFVGDHDDSYSGNTIYAAKAYADHISELLIGAASDAKTANTIYGAKKYADEAVTYALTLGTF